MNNLLVICGPTATGKTALAINLAKKFNGELVSADSRQVYRGMDIGTGKDLLVNSKFQIPPPQAGQANSKQIPNSKFQIGYYFLEGIPLWLYDVVEPNYRFSVADYVKCAEVVIKDIWQRGKLPILVGGTGFYIKALIDGIETLGVPPDWELREKLGSLEIRKLREILKKVDSKRLEKMNESDRNNPRRLIRAIEIAGKIQNSKFQIPNKFQISNLNIKNILFIGLRASCEVLYERIDRRVEERVKQGIIEEIKKLIERGYNWENSVLGETIGYKEWRLFFERKASEKEIIKLWKFAEHAYARRQMTWFKKDKRIHWFDISQKKWQDKIEALVEDWLNGQTENS
jgi:tRNA dimethylallyltransferase